MTSLGGHRSGAGRRRIDDSMRRVTYTMRLLPSTVEGIRALKEQGLSVGQMVDEIVRARLG